MRMGSDAGRDFLSTKDPVKPARRQENVDLLARKAEIQPQLSFAGMLERFFASKKSGR